jgi:hypothetical protein
VPAQVLLLARQLLPRRRHESSRPGRRVA